MTISRLHLDLTALGLAFCSDPSPRPSENAKNKNFTQRTFHTSLKKCFGKATILIMTLFSSASISRIQLRPSRRGRCSEAAARGYSCPLQNIVYSLRRRIASMSAGCFQSKPSLGLSNNPAFRCGSHLKVDVSRQSEEKSSLRNVNLNGGALLQPPTDSVAGGIKVAVVSLCK